MKIPLFVVDAFTSRRFGGNPAAVCPLESWLPEKTLQSIAAENNLSETAFFVGRRGHYELRWFTPTAEVDLCGHATLASAYVAFEELQAQGTELIFITRSGPLKAVRQGSGFALDFPLWPLGDYPVFNALTEALGDAAPEAVFTAGTNDYLAVFKTEAEVLALVPDFDEISALDRKGLIVTAPGDTVDFVSRYFAPRWGIPEDPVTGSAHCALAPYWGRRLEKRSLTARQISKRGGDLTCVLEGDRVIIGGGAVLYAQGLITLDVPAPVLS